MTKGQNTTWGQNVTIYVKNQDNCNKGMKCHRRGLPYYMEIKCHNVTLALTFGTKYSFLG
jgi:hypothetical protein